LAPLWIGEQRPYPLVLVGIAEGFAVEVVGGRVENRIPERARMYLDRELGNLRNLCGQGTVEAISE
jgi:hypothetical protein